MQDSQGKDNIISSAEKTIDLIELLAESGGTLTVSGIAKKLKMHVSSADRYLLTLQSRGYVNKDSRTGLFRLNETLISLSDLLVANHPLTRMYLDTMHTLAYIYNTTTHIAAFNNREAIYLHKDLQTQNMSYNRAFFDKTRYLYCSAPGKLLLSTYSDEELADYLLFLHNVGVDGIIVQDLGVIRLARQIVPELPLHASTQMTITNSSGVDFAVAAGMERSVLARERS